jgi:hypothetical protein
LQSTAAISAVLRNEEKRREEKRRDIVVKVLSLEGIVTDKPSMHCTAQCSTNFTPRTLSFSLSLVRR